MKLVNLIYVFMLVTAVSGCSFLKLSQSVKAIDASVTISGTISSNLNNGHPIIVTLNRVNGGETKLEEYAIVYGNGEYSYTVEPGDFYLFAFEDTNTNFTLDKEERVAWYGDPSVIQLASGESMTDIEISLVSARYAQEKIPAMYLPEVEYEAVNFNNTNLGKIVEIEDFSAEVGPLGMWEPVKHFSDGHSGIFLLEPYDESKIPVYFVHGMSGSAYDWLFIIEHLDREKYQPWLVQYPSGIRLDMLKSELAQSISELQIKYNPPQTILVAHSMGGLVSRGALNELTSSDREFTINKFITISTPWLGHNSASMGVNYAPVAVPSWFDMVPGSQYLESLYKDSFAGVLDYYLLFGFNNSGGGVFGAENTDGTVTLKSQLSSQAQDEAIEIRGFNQTHVGILNDESIVDKLHQIFNAASLDSKEN